MTEFSHLEERSKVIAEAKTWLGTPYHHMARVKGAGVDCATILAEVYPVALGWEKIQVDFYPKDWHLHRDDERYMKALEKHFKEISEDQSGPGDIVVFKYGRAFSHGGIILEWPIVIHAYMQARSVVLENVFLNKELCNRSRRFFSPWA